MTMAIDTRDVCCVALELSKTSWVCAFAVPGESKVAIHKIKAGDTDRLLAVLTGSKAKAEQQLGRPLQIVLCYEVGYDGFWLARYLIARTIHTIVFDPASFLMPRRKPIHHSDRSIGRSQQQRSGAGGHQPGIECRFHTATFPRFQNQMIPNYTLSASGRSSNLRKVVVAQPLSLIRSPDAPSLYEKCGLVSTSLLLSARLERPHEMGQPYASADARLSLISEPGTGVRHRYAIEGSFANRGGGFTTVPNRD